jgi:hypothetical protein
MRNGKKAMQDTIGEATALTGGYANSYAETVGYEAYDEYLDELNEIALDLRDRAYATYEDEGDKLISDVTLLRSLDGDDYEKYLGVLEQYYKEGDYLLDKLAQMSDEEFEQFLQDVDAWENDRDYEMKKQQDELKRVANRLFSTEDGKVLARAMIRSCRMLEAGNDALPNDELQRLRANQDFVNTFITKLVDRKVFIGILEEI